MILYWFYSFIAFWGWFLATVSLCTSLFFFHFLLWVPQWKAFYKCFPFFLKLLCILENCSPLPEACSSLGREKKLNKTKKKKNHCMQPTVPSESIGKAFFVFVMHWRYLFLRSSDEYQTIDQDCIFHFLISTFKQLGTSFVEPIHFSRDQKYWNMSSMDWWQLD